MIKSVFFVALGFIVGQQYMIFAHDSKNLEKNTIAFCVKSYYEGCTIGADPALCEVGAKFHYINNKDIWHSKAWGK